MPPNIGTVRSRPSRKTTGLFRPLPPVLFAGSRRFASGLNDRLASHYATRGPTSPIACSSAACASTATSQYSLALARAIALKPAARNPDPDCA